MATPKDLRTLVDLAKTTQTLLTHYQSSLLPSSSLSTNNTPSTALANPLDAIKASTTLLRSHTTTLSLLLITPPLTPSAVIAKIGDVSAGVLSGLVAAAASTPGAGEIDSLGSIMRAELRDQVRRLLGSWGDVLALVINMAERRAALSNPGSKDTKGKDTGPSDTEKQDVLSATGVVWKACDALLKLCADGVVGLVSKKAEQLRAVLLDAITELKEWGEDVDDSDDDEAAGSDRDEDNAFADEDDIFGASNRLGKGDVELKALLDLSVKKLRMVGLLYQALIKRRLRTYPGVSVSAAAGKSPSPSTNDTDTPAPNTPPAKNSPLPPSPSETLDLLMAALKRIPEAVDDLASAFYDLDEPEARDGLEKCVKEARGAVELVRLGWRGEEDEFTVWAGKWVGALDAA
ncbi:hypothetical protein IQ07DRAFT_685546 [Pyrenochaeta sp. DS3sAY3a]|nr:hypothetical protein IQ07DRAFT_685546 [Pyrenochaeta sp. DS3sAY3a]